MSWAAVVAVVIRREVVEAQVVFVQVRDWLLLREQTTPLLSEQVVLL